MMAQHYKFSTGSASSEPSHSVPEDFDFTRFLLQSQPQVPEGTADGHVPGAGWPQKVQDVKRTGNPGYGMQQNYTGRGWSPMGTDMPNLHTNDATTSVYNSSCWAPGSSTVGNSSFSGANSSFNTGNLGYIGSNPGYDSNLSQIWGSNASMKGQKGVDARGGTATTCVDYGTAAENEGRDLYGYAWNEWERPATNLSPSNTTNPVVNPKNRKTSVGIGAVGSVNYGEGDLEELRASFFSGSRKKRRESSVSAQSSSSCQSKGNTSAKDVCSNSSKSYSEAMKELKQTRKIHKSPNHHKSNNVNTHSINSNNCKFKTSATKPMSHYHSVSPPPGFEASPLHKPQDHDTQYKFDDFMGTSAKVQQWLQQSQTNQGDEKDPANLTKQTKRSEKKQKSKKPNPLTGSVASFIRDWDSGTSESTDTNSLFDLRKAADCTEPKIPTTVENVIASNDYKCFEPDNLQNLYMNEEEKEFFDPKRIFKEPSEKPVEKKSPCRNSTDSPPEIFFDPKRIFKEPSEKPVEKKSPCRNSTDSPPEIFFDPKRIFQTRKGKDDKITRKEKDKLSDSVNYNTCDKSMGSQERTLNSNKSESSTQPMHSPIDELQTGSYKTLYFSQPDNTEKSSWHLNGSRDNSPIKNKGSAFNRSSPYTGVESPVHSKVGPHHSAGSGDGASPNLSASKSQNAKPKSLGAHKDFTPHKAKKEEDMHTRSQSRLEEQTTLNKRDFVPPGSGDGIHVSKQANSEQEFTPAKEDHQSSRRHKAFNLDDCTFGKDSTSTSNHSIPRTEKSKSSSNLPPSSSTLKHPGKSQQESQPGWKRNKTSKSGRSETRTGRHGRDKRELPRHQDYRSDSPLGVDRNGTAKVAGRHKETAAKGSRNRLDSDGTRSDTAAHYYDADQFYQWMKAIVHFAKWTGGFIVFIMLVLIAYFYSTCKLWLEFIIHIVRELWKSVNETFGSNSADTSSPRWWTPWLRWFKRGGDGDGDSHGHSRNSSDGCGCKPGQGIKADFIQLPSASSEAIKRIMSCEPEDAYAVLGVADNATDEDIKKYYRKQCVMVHPDKCNLRHASDAFQLLQKAYETLTDPMARYDLDRQRSSAVETEDMINDIYEKMKEAMNTLNCNMCEGKHKRYPMDRPSYEARYCRRHDTYHCATEGDMWAETSHMGFKWHYYACMDAAVFDITMWAKCQNLRHMEANACEVRYRIGPNRRRNPGPSMPRDSEPPPWQQYQQGFEDFRNGDEELDDLLRHFFGDRANRTANDPRTQPGYGSNKSTNRKRRHRKKKY